MRKLRLYIETSVWNFLTSEDVPNEQEITKKMFKQIKSGIYECYISDLVYTEIEKAPLKVKQKLKELIEEYNPVVLKTNIQVEELSQRYIKESIVPQRYNADVIHVAFAVAYDLDVIVSWNLEHIVKLSTRLKVNGINKKEGYREIEICTPQEVLI